MDETLHATLAGWSDFYLITGTAAAALTGLQFVVQTLLASDAPPPAGSGDPEDPIAAFGSPTVVHFSLALLVSAMLCAPWPGVASLRGSLGALALGALAYSAIVLRRALRQRGYAPVAEDWVWHVLLPGASYAALALAAACVGPRAEGPLFAVGAATLLLLCVGIHNAWDTVTYITVGAMRADAAGEPAPRRRDARPARGRGRR